MSKRFVYKVTVSMLNTDMSVILDALDNLLEEINTNCDRDKCDSCDPRRESIVRIRASILENAPKVEYNKDSK